MHFQTILSHVRQCKHNKRGMVYPCFLNTALKKVKPHSTMGFRGSFSTVSNFEVYVIFMCARLLYFPLIYIKSEAHS